MTFVNAAMPKTYHDLHFDKNFINNLIPQIPCFKSFHRSEVIVDFGLPTLHLFDTLLCSA